MTGILRSKGGGSIKEIIQLYYRYNTWANNRILDTVALLDEDQYRANSNPSFGSVHNTLVHIMSAQWIWLSRWIGSSPKSHLDPATFSDLNEIRTRWNEIESNTQRFITRTTEEEIGGSIFFMNSQNQKKIYPLWQLMMHQVNHATQHRSEIALILTCFNHSPGDLDLRFFIDNESFIP
ncbi:MAG: hypothetical protein GX577_16780 [Leptolinea sp.]|nr:hypothetical protein [Leptolinea sp.]